MVPFAYLVLILYAIGGTWLIATAKPAELAARVAGVFFAGALFLPQRLAFDLPVLPPISKFELVPCICLVGSFLAQKSAYNAKIFFGGAAVFFWISMLGLYGTTATNGDKIVFGATALPAVSYKDAVSESFRLLMGQGCAFWVGRAVFRSPHALEALLWALVIAGLTQIPLCLYELRMSPQLHKMVYGYGVVDFANIRRSGGYKPVGFTAGGLSMAIFLYSSVAAALTLRSAGPSSSAKPRGWWAPVLWGTLAISKNMGANVFALITAIATYFGTWRMALKVALVTTVFSFAYAYLRQSGLLDVYPFIDWLSTKSPERAASLEFRFVNEDAMLVRTMERPWFGWGGYGRGRVWNEYGQATIQDGAWIIVMSATGVVGLVGLFGMIGTPILGWTSRLKHWVPRERKLAVGLILIVSLRLLDLIPNGMFSPVTVLLAGALAGLKSHQARGPIPASPPRS